MTKVFTPELGQALFGKPSGAVGLGTDEHYASDRLRELVGLIDEKGLAEIAEGLLGGRFGYGADFRNGVFEMFPYYWGDCTCGFDDKEEAWSSTHDHSSNCFAAQIKIFEEKLEHEDGLEPYSEKWIARVDKWARENGWEHGFDGSGVHCDCPFQKEWEQFLKDNQHDTDCPDVRPNFRCGDLEIRWYKYIGRGMSVSRAITRNELRKIFRKCRKSLETQKEEEKS